MTRWKEGERARWQGQLVEIKAIDPKRQVCTLQVLTFGSSSGIELEIPIGAPQPNIPISELEDFDD